MSSGHGKYVRGACGILDEVDEARKVVECVMPLPRRWAAKKRKWSSRRREKLSRPRGRNPTIRLDVEVIGDVTIIINGVPVT
jgi:hypothetical protein